MRFPREVQLDTEGAIVRLEGAADVDRLARALHVATATLEEIGQFDKGMAGERAMTTLKDLGVWSERVERIHYNDPAKVERLAMGLFTTTAPMLITWERPVPVWGDQPESVRDRWRAYAIQVLDTEAVLG